MAAINKNKNSMGIFTRGGDKGRTSLAGGIRVPKNHSRIETNGAIDEANCFIGLLRCKLSAEHPWQSRLHEIQTSLMHTMSHIATTSESPKKTLSPKYENGAADCEAWMNEMTAIMGENRYFVLPGQTEVSSLCHIARATIRRAERELYPVVEAEEIEEWIPKYINRLSDLFFTLAQYDVYQANLPEDRVKPFRYQRNKE